MDMLYELYDIAWKVAFLRVIISSSIIRIVGEIKNYG